MPRKSPGPGHPVTTGMASVKPVVFRVSKDQRDELESHGRRYKPTLPADLVAKQRCFPDVIYVRRGKRWVMQ